MCTFCIYQKHQHHHHRYHHHHLYHQPLKKTSLSFGFSILCWTSSTIVQLTHQITHILPSHELAKMVSYALLTVAVVDFRFAQIYRHIYPRRVYVYMHQYLPMKIMTKIHHAIVNGSERAKICFIRSHRHRARRFDVNEDWIIFFYSMAKCCTINMWYW